MIPLWSFFLHKRQFSILLIIALLVAGAYSVIVIPKESAPEVIIPIGIVVTAFPGASPTDVEQLITNKIEDAVQNVDDMKKVTSVSRNGVSQVTVEFNANADVDRSITNLKDAVDTAKPELPEDATDPTVIKVNFADQPVLVLSISSDALPVEFTKLSKDVEREIEGIPGVSKVDVIGARKREVQVVVKPEALQNYGLSLGDVIAGLSSVNATVPVGTITTNNVEYNIQFEGDIEDPEEVRNIAISSVGGKPVFLRDVATVSTGVEKLSSISRVAVEGSVAENAITFYVYKRSGGDVSQITGAVREHLAVLQQPGGMLENSKIQFAIDSGKDVRKELGELVGAGLETVLLVMICLLLTLGWRESLVAALSIPLSFVIAFIGLLYSGNTINFVSLFALILSVGILVDSGIVVTEAIHTRMRKLGASRDDAAMQSIHEYAWPLIGGTMTTVAVFAPLFFISGIVGKFISSIPFTIIFVLLASIFVALGLVPLIAIWITKPTSGNKLEEMQEEWTHIAQEWYANHLRTFLGNPRLQNWFIASLCIGLVIAVFLPIFGVVKTVFFPGEDVNYIYLEVEAKRGTPITETDLTIRAVEEILYEKDYIIAFTATAGGSSPFRENPESGGIFGNITVELAEKEDRDITSAEAVEDLRAALSVIKTADVRVVEQENGPPGGSPVLIKFFGDDLGELAKVAERSENLLRSIDGTVDVTPSTKNIGTEFVFDIDTSKASALGLSPRAVASTLRTAVFGSSATTIRKDGEDIEVFVKLALDPNFTDPTETTNVSLDALKNIRMDTPNGPVLLGSVLSDRLSVSNASIVHEDRLRTESVSAYTNGVVTPTEVVSEFQERISEAQIPDNVRVSYGGETEDVNQSFLEMGFALVAGLVLMLAILVLTFNSIRYSLYLLSAVPLSLIGVFGGLALMREPLSFTSLLGVVALAGVIINHAIILMDSLIVYRDKITTEPLLEAVVTASVTRLRPIFLTTITTVVGMIPLARISDFWSPLAYAIMYGLTFAMILTLILIPTLFYRNEKKKLEAPKPWFYRTKNLFWHWPRYYIFRIR